MEWLVRTRRDDGETWHCGWLHVSGVVHIDEDGERRRRVADGIVDIHDRPVGTQGPGGAAAIHDRRFVFRTSEASEIDVLAFHALNLDGILRRPQWVLRHLREFARTQTLSGRLSREDAFESAIGTRCAAGKKQDARGDDGFQEMPDYFSQRTSMPSESPMAASSRSTSVFDAPLASRMS